MKNTRTRANHGHQSVSPQHPELWPAWHYCCFVFQTDLTYGQPVNSGLEAISSLWMRRIRSSGSMLWRCCQLVVIRELYGIKRGEVRHGRRDSGETIPRKGRASLLINSSHDFLLCPENNDSTLQTSSSVYLFTYLRLSIITGSILHGNEWWWKLEMTDTETPSLSCCARRSTLEMVAQRSIQIEEPPVCTAPRSTRHQQSCRVAPAGWGKGHALLHTSVHTEELILRLRDGWVVTRKVGLEIEAEPLGDFSIPA